MTAAKAPDSAAIRELRGIPGVGPSIARDLLDLGIRRVADLRGRDPQAMYERLCALHGAHVDRCMLYVFRCAVYFAETPDPDPELTLWWSWKDGGVAFTEAPR
jgi:hypothetical protein